MMYLNVMTRVDVVLTHYRIGLVVLEQSAPVYGGRGRGISGGGDAVQLT